MHRSLRTHGQPTMLQVRNAKARLASGDIPEHDRLEEVESCVDYADEYGYTPLMLVSGYADAYTMKLLLDAKAVVSKQAHAHAHAHRHT
eukprot:1906339-Pleurochrysis_carterae.AAC.1